MCSNIGGVKGSGQLVIGLKRDAARVVRHRHAAALATYWHKHLSVLPGTERMTNEAGYRSRAAALVEEPVNQHHRNPAAELQHRSPKLAAVYLVSLLGHDIPVSSTSPPLETLNWIS